MRRLFALLLVASLARPSVAQPPAVPQELRGWEEWVLDGQEHLRCPILGGATAGSSETRLCIWPGPIEIDAGATGGVSMSNGVELWIGLAERRGGERGCPLPWAASARMP